ncbi:MAG: hypothetical protein Q8910_00670 [Bacteroidota bacterium]|nr:hypothetical protein [Bacteroidota bacterium]
MAIAILLAGVFIVCSIEVNLKPIAEELRLLRLQGSNRDLKMKITYANGETEEIN